MNKYAIKRKRITKIPLHKKILYCLTWPIFDIIGRYTTYIAIFNLSEEERGINCWINQIASSEEGSYRGQTLHELWNGRETVPHAGGLAALIPAHGVRLFWYSNN